MNLLCFFLGALIVAIAWAITHWITKNNITLSWQIWTGMIIGIFMALFCIAWCVSSIIEGEAQSAGMGLLIFGSLSLIILFITRKFYSRNNRLV